MHVFLKVYNSDTIAHQHEVRMNGDFGILPA